MATLISECVVALRQTWVFAIPGCVPGDRGRRGRAWRFGDRGGGLQTDAAARSARARVSAAVSGAAPCGGGRWRVKINDARVGLPSLRKSLLPLAMQSQVAAGIRTHALTDWRLTPTP